MLQLCSTHLTNAIELEHAGIHNMNAYNMSRPSPLSEHVKATAPKNADGLFYLCRRF